jgi:hypothetical protein
MDECKRIAQERRGQCLSRDYINAQTKLRWRCAKGHEWDAIPSSVKSGKWCPICGGSNKLTITEMKQIASGRQGVCLSFEYKNALSPLRWRCKYGHEWTANANNIKRGSWCPLCAGQGKLTIMEMKIIAKEKGGECLSGKIINSKTKLKWRCAKGHKWDAIPESVKKGTWCPLCGIENVHNKQKNTIIEMRSIAISQGGDCLSTKYINQKVKLKWRCEKGHEWEASPTSIKNLKTWCPYCAGTVKKNIEEMKELANKRGGECLSSKYFHTQNKLKWMCKEGHVWEASPSNIMKGQWCPICSKGISERICRKIFEEIFQKKFPSVKPKWLVYPLTKGRMELDGYCDDLKIAFEYQGEQHYRENKQFFHKKQSYEKQVERDRIKRELCEAHGIILIDVPFWISHDKLAEYIISICNQYGLKIPSVRLNIFDYTSLDGIYSSEKIKKMQELAQIKGGDCLSEHYIDSKTKLRWRCKEGHEWIADPGHIQSGKWCPFCGGSKRLTLEEMKLIANSRGGECISEEYINSSIKLKWRCNEGHEWNASPENIKAGKWCPYCKGLYSTIEDMNQLAIRKGGECVSKKFLGAHNKLKWKCTKGHTWDAIPSSVRRGSWCPYCLGKHQTIEEMKQFALSKGGKCLSETYINNRMKLKWRCSKGHEWEASPGHIRSGGWCPICAGNTILSIEEMKSIAVSRGGECLSKEYLNSRKKLKWTCSKGHEWDAWPSKIKAGGWCPICKSKKNLLA